LCFWNSVKGKFDRNIAVDITYDDIFGGHPLGEFFVGQILWQIGEEE
jgi:hypothetical protein